MFQIMQKTKQKARVTEKKLFKAREHLSLVDFATSGLFKDLISDCVVLRGRFACVSLVVCYNIHLGLMGALYIELSSCFTNKNKLYTWISGTSAEELKKK